MRLNVAVLAALQALLVSGQSNSTEAPSEVPYYGQSPPVYPTPVGNGSTNTQWAAAYKRAKAIVAQMTLEEKSNITRGYTSGPCIGNTGSVERLGIAALCISDAPDGIRGQEFVSAFPAGIHVASTFDHDLMYKYGAALGEEYYAKGINQALAPVAGPLGRMARGGRNWEGLSNDPYLAGIGMGAITKGIQAMGVIATPKHWLFNEQEFRRTISDAGEAMSSDVDDRTLHELYAFPFMNSLKEGAGSVLCGYNRVNQSYSCQNSKLMNGILKTELGFEGFIISDWVGQHTGTASANAGLDMVMPDGGYWGDNLTQAVTNGSVSTERMDDMATRIMASFYLLDQQYTYPEPSIYTNAQKNFAVNAQSFDHAELIHDIGAAGTVLVKNVNGTLPFKKPRYLAVYGYDAVVKATPWENYLRFGGGYEVNFGWNTLNGTQITGGGSGSNTPSYVIDPFMALSERIRKENGVLRWDFWSENPSPAFSNAEHCLVFINSYASESFDRETLKDEFSDNLVKNVATNCSSTIVVIHNAGIRIVDEWIDNPNVTAVIYAGLPGQESGRSIVSVLYGDVNPSGRLPYTVAKNESDYGALLNSTVSDEFFPSCNFTEGLYIDYRAFDKEGIEPQFAFGYGLSYTTFAYSALSASVIAANNDTAEWPDASVKIVQGGHPELWDVVALAKVSVENTGDVSGAEVAQLYVTIPVADTPVRQLRGFKRLGPMVPGEARQAVFPLTRRDLSTWDVAAQQWRLARGTYDLSVGASSRDLRLNATIEIV